MHDLDSILLKIPDVLSTSSDNEVGINLKLSINLSLYVIVFFFLILFSLSSKEHLVNIDQPEGSCLAFFSV